MNTRTQLANHSACRPTNPGACAGCTLSFRCHAQAREEQPAFWPLIALSLFAIIAVLSASLPA